MTKIIAELASGHNGDLDLLKALVKAAAENGADLCKVQDWRSKNVPSNDLDKQRYEKYEFRDEWWPDFLECCKENNIEPLTTVFNKDRVKFLADLGLKKIKLASISLTNHDLISMAGAYFDELIISTAMHSKEEIEEAIDLLATNAKKFTILHCVANYPTTPGNANLDRIDELKKMIEGIENASVGYSDHSLELEIPKIALAKGISYLEKHFTLSRYLPQIPHEMYEGGPLITTHQISIEPHELKELAEWRDWVKFTQEGRFEDSLEVEQKIKDKYSKRYGK